MGRTLRGWVGFTRHASQGVSHSGWPSQLAQGKLSTEMLGQKGPTQVALGLAVGAGHMGWPCQLALGMLSTEWLGDGLSTDGIGGRQWE